MLCVGLGGRDRYQSRRCSNIWRECTNDVKEIVTMYSKSNKVQMFVLCLGSVLFLLWEEEGSPFILLGEVLIYSFNSAVTTLVLSDKKCSM